LCDLRVQRSAHDAHPVGQGYLTFLSCDRVYASSLRMLTDAGPAGADLGGVPLAAVHAEDSKLWFSDCRLEGSGPATDAGAVEVAGANGVQVFDSLLYLALADVHAGERSGPVGLLRSGAALAATRSQVILHGGKTNHLRGGAATVDGPGGELLAGAALVLDGQSQGTWGADVDFAPGGGPGGQVQLAVEAATGAALDPRADRLPSMWIPNPNPPLGEFQAVLLEGDPGAIQFWWLTLASGPSIHIPGIEGPLVMDLGLVVSHAPVVLNEDGLGTDTAWAPPDPVLGGLVLAYQSLEFDGTRLQFAPPWFITFAFL
jgi:hypothetical protein